MNKSKKRIQSAVKYLRELSIIVVGVSITVIVGLWVNKKSNENDQKQYLEAIILELKQNIEILDEAIDFLKDWDAYSRYLESHDRESLHPDSIRGIDYPGLGHINIIVFHSSAFEMYKGSGAMRLINDKELLLSLWKTYLFIENVTSVLDTYYQYKKDELIRESRLYRAGTPLPVPLYDFFYSMAGSGTLETAIRGLLFMEALVEIIENSFKR